MIGPVAEICIGLGLACIIVGSALAIVKSETTQIQKTMQELRTEIKAHRELIGQLQEQVEYANAKATWLLKKIDKRRILVPVMNGDVYKLVEIETEVPTFTFKEE